MGEFTPKFERDLESRNTGPKALPTAGAIAVRNEKGEITMQKVKVVRYMAGKMCVSHHLSFFRELSIEFLNCMCKKTVEKK